MTDGNSNRPNGQVTKPYPEYPLTPHRHARQWCKKIKGKIYYFGPLSDPKAALERYLNDRDYLFAGQRPPQDGPAGLTVQEMVNGFLTSKKRMINTGELQPRSFLDYYDACKMLVTYFGKTTAVKTLTPAEFAGLRKSLTKHNGSGKSVGLVTLKNRIGRCMAVFRWAMDNRLVDKIYFGTEFKPPSVKAIRIERSKKPARLFTVEEVRRLLEECPTIHLKTMILLGINCGLGNHDVSDMEISHANLDSGWLNYPRIKTGIDRKAKLWPETVESLRQVLAKRKQPQDPADKNILFLTKKHRRRYIVYTGDVTKGKAVFKSSIVAEFGKLLANTGIDRSGVGFYSLRHTFRTIADNLVGDQRAIDYVMGHKRGDISEVYTHAVKDDRLERIAQAVHDWLFPVEQQTEGHHDG